MNPQKFEKLIHQFFGNSCLEIEVIDSKGISRRPREWFVVPLEKVEEAIVMIMNERILNYKYDKETGNIIER
jgi:hypothetical protein